MEAATLYQEKKSWFRSDLTLTELKQKEQNAKEVSEKLTNMQESLQKKSEELKSKENSLNSRECRILEREKALGTTITACKKKAHEEAQKAVENDRIAINKDRATIDQERQELEMFKQKCKKEADEKAQNMIAAKEKKLEKQIKSYEDAKKDCQDSVSEQVKEGISQYFILLCAVGFALFALSAALIFRYPDVFKVLMGIFHDIIYAIPKLILNCDFTKYIKWPIAMIVAMIGGIIAILGIYGYLPKNLLSGTQEDWLISIAKVTLVLYFVIANIFEPTTTASVIVGVGYIITAVRAYCFFTGKNY